MMSGFDDTTEFWRRMRVPGDVVFVPGAPLMAFDFPRRRCPLRPGSAGRRLPGRSCSR